MGSPTLTWQHDISLASQAKFAKFAKKHSREYAALFANLDRIIALLRAGHKIGAFQVGFFRSEGAGVWRIGQTRVPSAKESRLYVFPDDKRQVMFILGIGTKDSQQTDINEAKESAKNTQAPESKQ